MRVIGEGRRARGLLLGRFYFSKWLTFLVLGHKKVLVLINKAECLLHRLAKRVLN